MDQEMTCRVCGNCEGNRSHLVREMLFGTRHKFLYDECALCGTLQIREIPTNISDYYPTEYYSFESPSPVDLPEGGRVKRRLRRMTANYLGTGRGLLGKLYLEKRAHWLRESAPQYLAMSPGSLGITTKSKVLDIGSGSGHELFILSYFQFSDLTGIDPYVRADVTYPNGVKILKARTTDIEGAYDFVMMHHSFEHMPDAEAALREVHRLLKPKRFAVIRIPLVSHAWRRYGVNWVQLDAPRHLHLFTEQSFKALAVRCGLVPKWVVYDSTGFQFYASEYYERDVPLVEQLSERTGVSDPVFSREELICFEEMARELNEREQGDQAIFYLYKE